LIEHPPADVVPEDLARPVDFGDGRVGPPEGAAQVGVERADGEDAPAGAHDVALLGAGRRDLGGAGVEDLDAGQQGGAVEAADDLAGHRPPWIAGARQHDAGGGLLAERQAADVEVAGRSGPEERQQVVLQAHEDHLRLGIAEPGVELEHARPLRGQHQAGVEHAGERPPLGRHPGDSGLHDALDDRRGGLGRHHTRRTVAAHAAGVGSAVAVADPFVVLGKRQREDAGAVAQGHEGDLLAFQERLDDQPLAAHAKTALFEHRLHGGVEFGSVLRDDDPFARRQAVRLEHGGPAELAARRLGLRSAVGDDERRGRDAVAFHELLGEHLAPLDLGGALRGAEDGEAAGGELVGEAEGERQLRPDDGQVDLHLESEVGQPVDLLGRQRHEVGDLADPRVAGGAVEVAQQGALAQFPAQGVLARTAPDDQDFHAFLRSAAARAVTAMTSRMSSVEQPRERSLTGRSSPWRSGPTARAPARRSVSL